MGVTLSRMDFEELAKNRRSVHSFSEKEVSRKTILEIVETARFAPSAWNLQPWKILVLESEDAKRQAYTSSYDQDFILDTDKVAVICGDLRFDSQIEEAFEDAVEKDYMSEEEAEAFMEQVRKYGERDEDWKELELTSNCMFLASHFINAAEEKGVATCPVKGFDQRELKRKLELEDFLPVMLIPLGYPEENSQKKWRRDPEDLVEFR